jgi:hypothetical protein
VTVPWVNRGDGANVVWTQEADEMWAAVAADAPVGNPDGDTPDGNESPADDAPSLGDNSSAAAPGEDSDDSDDSDDESESC